MKALHVYILGLLFLSPLIIFSQIDTNDHEMKWMKGWTNFAPNQIEYLEPDETLKNIIDTDTYLKNDTVYLLSGDVYVINGASLSIEEGTVIRGDVSNKGSLIITKGAKLFAKGSKTSPIIFTSNSSTKSRKAGDWGGIIIAGSAKINTSTGTGVIEGDYTPQYSSYGGLENDETTTIMSFVRIEYAGKKTSYDRETNGLTLYALGNMSSINNIMVSYSADDSFEWFGGSIHMKNLVSYKTLDDDFDFSSGYRGKLNNIVAIRHPYVTDASGSYAIEMDGYDHQTGFSTMNALSNVTIKNAALINLTNRTNFQHTTSAIALRNRGRLKLDGCKISGFSNIVQFDNSFNSYQDLSASFSLENSIYNIHQKAIATSVHINKKETLQLLKYNMFTNRFQNATEFFTNPFHTKHPKFTLKEDTFDSSTVMQ